MKKLPSNYLHTLFLTIMSSILLLTSSSCSNKISFETSSVVPAARGDVKVKKGDNNNYVIEIELTDLAEPDRLQPSRDVYVVWMKTRSNVTKNIGQIETSSGFLSNQLKSSFETVTPFKPTRIFITAEEDATIQYPQSQVVLSTDNF